MSEAAPTASTGNGTNGASGQQSTQSKGNSTDIATGPQTSSASGTQSSQKGETTSTKIKIKDFEFNSEDDLHRELLRTRQANKLLSEASNRARQAEEKEKSYSEKLNTYKKDLGRFFEDTGISQEEAEALASSWLYKARIEPSQMSQEQLRIRELETQLSRFEEAKQQAAMTEKQREQQAVIAEQAKALESEILEAIQSARIPGDKQTLRRIAGRLADFEERGLSVPLETIASMVRDDVAKETGEFVASASVEDLRQFWGDAAFKAHAKRMLDWAMQQLKPTTTATPVPRVNATSSTTGERLTPQQFFERIK